MTVEQPFKRSKVKEVGDVVNKNGLKYIHSWNDVLQPLSDVASGSSVPPIVAKWAFYLWVFLASSTVKPSALLSFSK